MKSSVATADREMFAQFNVVIVLPMKLTFSRSQCPVLPVLGALFRPLYETLEQKQPKIMNQIVTYEANAFGSAAQLCAKGIAQGGVIHVRFSCLYLCIGSVATLVQKERKC
jgi:hypothetical protein